ncbi:Transposase family tnp2, partial [Rhizoctonia solani]
MPPAKNREECPCCGKMVHPQTVQRHLLRFQATGLLPVHPPYVGSTSAAPEENGKGFLGIPMDGPDDNQDTGGPKEPGDVGLPALVLIPITVEDWPKLPDDDPNGSKGSNSSESNIGDILVNSPDQDPPFEEVYGPTAFHPNNKVDFSNKEFCKLMERHLGTMTDAEWFELYSTVLYNHDINTMKFLATRLRTHFSQVTYNDFQFGLSLFQNAKMAKKLWYCVELEAKHNPAKVVDVFNSAHYQKLRTTPVNPDQPYCFFNNPEDIALLLSTNGFTLFKRRRWGYSTAWPIILINNNLSAKIQTQLESVICVGVIPGPWQCKDLNSFLILLLNELLELKEGVDTMGVSPKGEHYYFTFWAFLIHIFGNILAISKLLSLTGFLFHYNQTSVYYVPLTHPEHSGAWNINALPMQSHRKFLRNYDKLKDPQLTKMACNKLAQHYGINARPIFAHLKSVNLASCAPYNIMHLFFKNLVPNLIMLWTGKFKGLDKGNGLFLIPIQEWEAAGQETAKANHSIPGSFVGTLLDIAQDGHLYKAKGYLFWIQYIAPIVLKGRLQEPYYGHMLLLWEIILLCVEMEITQEKIDKLKTMIKTWVLQYKEYYYQYSEGRLSTCPLTIHAILHVAFYLCQTGPLWASWAFVMDRFCGHLLPAVKNCLQPYKNLDNYMLCCTQMRMVSIIHKLLALCVTPYSKACTKEGFELLSQEVYYPTFPTIVLGIPITKQVQYTDQLQNRIPLPAMDVSAWPTNGDCIQTSALVSAQDTIFCNNSFVRYSLWPDANAAFQRCNNIPFQEVLYGQIHNIYFVVFKKLYLDGTKTESEEDEDGEELDEDTKELKELQKQRKLFLLAFIEPCNTRGLDATKPNTPVVKYKDMLTPHMVHINTIEAVVGQVLQGDLWAIVDCSQKGAWIVFIDKD